MGSIRLYQPHPIFLKTGKIIEANLTLVRVGTAKWPSESSELGATASIASLPYRVTVCLYAIFL